MSNLAYITKTSFHIWNQHYFCFDFLTLGHIHQVKDNLSKKPKELIPTVFPNTWGWLPAADKLLLFSYVCPMHTLQLVTGISAALSCPSGLPGAFQAALHGVLTASGYEQAIRDNMSCGGCTCSRSSFIGACIGAQVLQKSWPCYLFDHIVLYIKQSRLYVIKVKLLLCYLLNTYLSEQSIPIFHRMIIIHTWQNDYAVILAVF